MVNNNYRTLKDDDGKVFVFSEEKLNQLISELVLSRKNQGKKCNKSIITAELAEKVNVSIDAVKNWSHGRNGVGDIETIKTIAQFFETEYHNLLEAKSENEHAVNDIQRVAISNLYHKIQPLLEMIGLDPDPWKCIVASETPFNKEGRLAGITSYNPIYDDEADRLIEEFNQSLKYHMADIPYDLYDDLYAFVNDEIGRYVGKRYVEMSCIELRAALEAKECDYVYISDVKERIKEDIEYIFHTDRTYSICNEADLIEFKSQLFCDGDKDFIPFSEVEDDYWEEVNSFLKDYKFDRISEGIVWNNQLIALSDSRAQDICAEFFKKTEKRLFTELRSILKPYVR